MVDSVSFDFVVQSLVEFAEFFDAIADTVFEVLVALWFFVSFAVDFKEGFVIGFDNIDIKIVAFSTLRVEGSPAALVVARHRQSNHVAADGAA